MTEAVAVESTSKMATFGTKVKEGAFWMGRQIKVGWNKLTPIIKIIFQHCVQFLRTGFGFATVGLITGTALITAAFASKKCNQNKWAMTGMTLTGTALIAGSIALMVLQGPAAIL